MVVLAGATVVNLMPVGPYYLGQEGQNFLMEMILEGLMNGKCLQLRMIKISLKMIWSAWQLPSIMG